MSHSDNLTQREKDFARHYVANGGDGQAAAIKAGYSKATAKVQASQILGRKRVQDEIARLRGAVDRTAKAIMKAATIEADAVQGEIIPPEQVDAVHKAIADQLTRNYVVVNLMEIVEIGMGKRPTMLTKIIKETRRDANGAMTEELTAVQVEQRERDLSAAVAALKALNEEVNRRELKGNGEDATDITPAEERARQMEEMLRPFKQLYPMVTPRANGHTNGHGNGHATNGHGG